MIDNILRGSRRDIFNLLASADEQPIVISQYAIADATGYSVRQVQRSIEQLCTTGMITRQPLGPGRPHLYEVIGYE
jgi:predicted transcriptional regulator